MFPLTTQQVPGGPTILRAARGGSTFFVDSNGGGSTTSGGLAPESAFTTLAAAIGACTASKGDVIYLMPGHAETIAAATTLDLNKIGVSVIGLGNRHNRPIITFAGVDSVLGISAASTVLQNVKLAAGIDEVVKAISVTASHVTLDTVDISETTSKQFIQFCLTSALATDLTIQNCTHHQSTASASNALWIQLIGADRAKILNNRIFITTTNSASSSVIESDTTAPVNILIQGNIIVQLGGTGTVPIKLVANTSGMVCDNRVASLKTAIAGSIACASCYAALNYAGHVVNTSGLLEPVVDA